MSDITDYEKLAEAVTLWGQFKVKLDALPPAMRATMEGVMGRPTRVAISTPIEGTRPAAAKKGRGRPGSVMGLVTRCFESRGNTPMTLSELADATGIGRITLTNYTAVTYRDKFEKAGRDPKQSGQPGLWRLKREETTAEPIQPVSPAEPQAQEGQA